MYWVALGLIGLGDWISEVDRGRPFGMSMVMLESRREARLELDEECLSFDEECLDACGWLDSGVLCWVVGDMVAINDIVVPISLTGLEGGSLEFECSLPGTGLGGSLVLGKRKLAGVVVPRPEKMDGLAAGRSAESK